MLPRWLGARPGRFGVSLVTGCTILGMLACLVTGRGPGLLLNVFLLAGTVAAVLCVRPRAVYLVIPVPAVAYLIAAVVTGLVSDRIAGSSRTAVLISAAQWVAAGFLAMTVATLLVVAVTVGYLLARWHGSRRRRFPADDRYPADDGYADDGYPAGDGYSAGDGYPAEASWPAWNSPPGR
jgi:hypothetical protein